MAELSAQAGNAADIDFDRTATTEAPPLAPSETAIDRAHLSRMTQGESGLEQEVLGLFGAQLEILLGRMDGAPPALIGAQAHTLAGSARGIGAWKMAEAASAVEAAVAAHRDPAGPVRRLVTAAREAQVAIADLVRA